MISDESNENVFVCASVESSESSFEIGSHNKDSRLVNHILQFLSKVGQRQVNRRNLLENIKEIYFSSDVKSFKKELKKIAKRENYHEAEKYEDLRWEVEKVRDREKRRELELSKMKSQNERMSQILENYQKELEHLKTENRKTFVDAQIQSAPKIDASVLKQKDEIITKLRSELAISRIDIPEGKDLASENRKLQKIIIELEHGVEKYYNLAKRFKDESKSYRNQLREFRESPDFEVLSSIQSYFHSSND